MESQEAIIGINRSLRIAVGSYVLSLNLSRLCAGHLLGEHDRTPTDSVDDLNNPKYTSMAFNSLYERTKTPSMSYSGASPAHI